MSVMGARPIDLTDDELVKGCLARDEASVRIVTGRYNQRLFRIARGILGNDGDAEDAVQDAYLKAFAGLERFRGESSLGTWLTRILMNEALGRSRRRSPVVLAEDTAAGSAAIVSDAPSADLDPETTLAQTEMRDLLEQSIDRLPAPFRVVFVARFVEGMSVEETAAAFQLRPETVKTRAHRARARLRADLRARLGATVHEAFRFDGARCDRLTDAVLRRLRSVR
jgi:RNA polymerase sigma-70 factor (ECF subfamily)